MNREKRREKVIRTKGYKPKSWIKVFAFTAVLAMFLMGMLAGAFSK